MWFAVARSISNDEKPPFEYLSGGTEGAWLWTPAVDRALSWNTALSAHEMLKLIGSPKGATVRSIPNQST